MSGDRPPKTTDPSDLEATDEDFLRRWSRRKHRERASDAGPETPASRGSASTEPGAHSGPAECDSPAEKALADADMPPLESLDESSDYSGFFSTGVSEKLRRAALRKLFRSPMFNVVDGLDDYDEDFRTFQALGDLVTSDIRGRLERESERRDHAMAPAGKDAVEGAAPASRQAGRGRTAEVEHGGDAPSPTGSGPDEEHPFPGEAGSIGDSASGDEEASPERQARRPDSAGPDDAG